MSLRGLLTRAAAVSAVATLLLGLGAGVAAAHVTVNPGEAVAGSYAKLTFRVPNESATASTVSVQVTLPADTPIPSVSLQPVVGWTADTTVNHFDPPVTVGRFTLDEAMGSITWTADNGVGVEPGQFQEFAISVGPVPDVEALTFPATQTYSDGTVVHWDQVPSGTPGEALDHPAPRLIVTSGDEAAETADASEDTAQLLAAIGLVVAAVALVVAVIALRRSAGTRGPAAGSAGSAAARSTRDDSGNAS